MLTILLMLDAGHRHAPHEQRLCVRCVLWSTAVLIGCNILLPALPSARHPYMTQLSTTLQAVAALVLALVLSPLHHRLESWIERAFFGTDRPGVGPQPGPCPGGRGAAPVCLGTAQRSLPERRSGERKFESLAPRATGPHPRGMMGIDREKPRLALTYPADKRPAVEHRDTAAVLRIAH